jgi:hypothetical protein
MAELADAADSKSAGTWYLAGSIPVPGTNVSFSLKAEVVPLERKPFGSFH